MTFSSSQAAYIAIITKRFGLAELQKTPMLPSGAVYSKDDTPSDPSYVTRKKNSWYREAAKAIAGSLMHACGSHSTRNRFTLSQFLENPG
jgi:hypothetical protein